MPRTHCTNGHEMTPDNTFVRSDGRVYCRACVSKAGAPPRDPSQASRRATMQAWRDRNREHVREYHREYHRAARARKKAQHVDVR
jgi:hypothetical protein